MNKILVIITLFLGLSSFQIAQAQSANQNQSLSLNTDRLIGTIIKQALEQYHFNKVEFDDSLSKKAFEQFLQKFDYSKQFFYQADVKKLEKFRLDMEDQMTSGNIFALNEAIAIYRTRIAQADKIREKVFKKTFDFKKKEYLELDPEKREWLKSDKEFENYWSKTFKYQTLNRFLSLKESQEEKPDEKKENFKINLKKKSKKKEIKKEKLTRTQMLKKAHEGINKKYKRIFERLLEEDREDLDEKFINSITTIFDPHTIYLPPRRKEDFDIDISGKLEGIGAVLQEDGPHIKVVKIVPGGAAWKQKDLEVNDLILYVGQDDKKDPVDLLDMRVDDAVRYIRGPKGTTVHLTVKKADGSRKVISIVRDVVKIEASFAKSSVIEHKDLSIKVGYIHVPKFYRDFGTGTRNCTDDVRRELERLKKKGVDAMILDLRNNGGGALEDAKQMSGLFIKKGPIVQIKDHEKNVEVMRDVDTSVTYDGPLVVMINRFSASASEILAGALQDYKRAIVVGGEFSHGKGTVQAVVPLSANPIFKMFGKSLGALKVTIQKFYRISGESTQFKGITPDIILPDQFGYTESREKDLVYALPWDKVAPLEYDSWKKPHDIKKLGALSAKRVKEDSRFKKVKDYVDYLLKKKDKTLVSLSEDENIKEDLENKKIVEKLKLDEEEMAIKVSAFEESLKENLHVKSNEKVWKEDFVQRKEEWVKQLRQDPMLEETLFILNDAINLKGKKVSMN
ncbi:MAG: carboxy terminal-processing peptidase [Bacteriovoracaceae bacterium]